MISARLPSSRRARVPGRALAVVVLTAALALGWVQPAGAAPAGTLDPTFGVQGAVLDPAFSGPTAIVPAGARTYVTAQDRGTSTLSERPVVLALTADGHLDPTFGNAGVVRFTDSFDTGPDLEPAPGGGVFSVRTVPAGRTITWLDAAGVPVASFGVGGSVTAPGFIGDFSLLWSEQHADADGITMVGTASAALTRVLVLLRFGLDGRPAASFGSQGVATFPLDPNRFELPQDATRDALGRTVVVVGDGFFSASVLRFGANGVLDPTFGTGGVARPTRDLHATRVAIDGAGRLVLLGTAELPGSATRDAIPVLARLSSAGVADTTYGTGGVVGLHHVDGLYASGDDLAIDPAGRAVFAFSVRTIANQLSGVARVDAAGALDPTFGFGTGAGVAAWPLPRSFYALALDPTGRPLVSTELPSTGTSCPPVCTDLLVLRLRAS